MYWGSSYCTGCKYNRNCYMANNDLYGYIIKSHCIIAENIFLEKYKEENKKEEE